MSGIVLAAVLLLAALAQVAVAPLFPVSAALPDLVLVVLAVTVVFRGPRAAMAGIPIAALLYSFAADRAPGLMLIAYLPLLPLAAYLAGAGLPLNRFAQTLIAGAGTGLWARLVLALAAMGQGAQPEAGLLITAVLLPGLFLDLVLLAVVYLAARAMGASPRPMSLRRSEYELG